MENKENSEDLFKKPNWNWAPIIVGGIFALLMAFGWFVCCRSHCLNCKYQLFSMIVHDLVFLSIFVVASIITYKIYKIDSNAKEKDNDYIRKRLP